MSRPYRILITGSREWTDEKTLHDNLVAAANAHWRGSPDPVVIVHGHNPRGADAMADAVYERYRVNGALEVERHPADWNQHGKRAGPIRNAEMVALGADLCLAFPTASSVGTWDCVRKANAAGIRVVIVPEPRTEGTPA